MLARYLPRTRGSSPERNRGFLRDRALSIIIARICFTAFSSQSWTSIHLGFPAISEAVVLAQLQVRCIYGGASALVRFANFGYFIPQLFDALFHGSRHVESLAK
jgi:hypothetical protein